MCVHDRVFYLVCDKLLPGSPFCTDGFVVTMTSGKTLGTSPFLVLCGWVPKHALCV